MFVIDVALKNSPTSLSVQRKTIEDAKALYQQVMDAIKSGSPVTLELTCEQQQGKSIAILMSEVAAVQISEKGAASSSGRPPGFFAVASEAAQ